VKKHLRLFGLLMHVGAPGKKSKTEAMYCPARDGEYEAGDTSDLVLDCGGMVGFTLPFVYLGSLLHRDLSENHDVDARIKKASKAFGALRDHFFSTRDVSERLKGKIFTGGVLAVLLYGCESWCLTAESISRRRNWHNKRIREMCRVTMCQSFVHQISSASSHHFFSTRDVSERLKGKIFTGGVLAVLLYGCESWCLTAESISRLRNWHNKRIREMCRVTMYRSKT